MTDLLTTTQTALLDWTSKAISGGWLAPNALEHVKTLNAATPSQLFTGPERPLVVGFFGGTGVGKSSLMNRLAGESIARASAERPTSTNITAYVHSSVRVDRLPADFPIEKLQTAIHHNNDYASVLWLDMPDFDSVETSHRHLVELWLPYIDVLVYVVSPERYKDDEGWRLLQKHGTRHAWLFVMNHWDRGDPIQKQDFTTLLQSTGIESPLLFCTDCNPAGPSVNDDFQQFDETIKSLANQQFIGELEKRGVFQRIGEIQTMAAGLQKSLGNETLIERWQSQWGDHWTRKSDELTQAVLWQIPNLAEQYAEPEGAAWLRWIPGIGKKMSVKKTNNETTSHLTTRSVNQLFDDITLQRIDDAVASFAHEARTENVHTQALATELEQRRSELPARLAQTTNTALSASLQNPGEAWQRGLHALFRALATLLPLAVMGWAGYKLVTGFADGGSSAVQYLGVNFAVHTLMLTGLAWAIPSVLHKKTKPSRVAAAQRGLEQGLQNALMDVKMQVSDGIEQSGRSRGALLAELQDLQKSPLPNNSPPALSESVTQLLVH